MKPIFIFCLILLFKVSPAQFFALEYDSVNPYVTVLPYPMDANYRVLSYDHSFPSVPVNRTRIKVYDSTQHYVKTINLLRGITLVNDYPPLLYNKRLLWPANYKDTVDHANNALAILELDTNYNHVALHIISKHATRAEPTGLVAYSKGFVVGEYFNGPSVSATGFSTKVFKLDLNLHKKDSAFFADELRLKTHTSMNDKIVGASDDISPSCSSTSLVTQRIVLDTNLTIVDCLNIPISSVYFCYDAGGAMIASYPQKFMSKSIIFPLSNFRNYIQGEMDVYCPPPTAKKGIVSSVLKGNLLGMSHLNSHNPDNTEFPLYLASDCDYYGSNTINVGTIGLKANYPVDKSFYLPYYAKLKTKMSVTKSDTLGYLVWSRAYGGEMNYYARSVAFTADGGCVVAGSRYDSATFYPNKVFQNFLMKLDAYGNVINVGVNENVISSVQRINCFPNPASERVYFDIPLNEIALVEVYNGLGQLVLQKENYTSRPALSVSEFEEGMYSFKITTSHQVYSGKILKQ